MNEDVNDPIAYRLDENDKHIVTYTAPSRKFGNFREELYNDAKTISNKYGHVYIGFSSGIDSQTIIRSFIDAGADFTPFYINAVGYNDHELNQLSQCETFYNIKVRIISFDLASKKDDWLRRKIEDNFPNCTPYNIADGVTELEGNDPIIISGPELHILGWRPSCAYHNYQKGDNLRFQLIRKFRTLLTWPYSPEAIASLYCDDLVKAYITSKKYFDNNGFVIKPHMGFNTYVKPLLKAKYFKDDLIYFSKKTGYEEFPDWIGENPSGTPPKKYSVSTPITDAISHLESCDGSIREYSSWHFL
jgi:hypothetical protein